MRLHNAVLTKILPHTSAEMCRRRLLLVGLLLIAFGVRTWNLSSAEFWLDEAVSHYIAKNSPEEIVRYTLSRSREHPPLYYLLLHGWMILAGPSEWSLRFFSAWWGTLFVALVFAAARRWFGERTAWLALLLTVAQPMTTQLARDARMYPMLMFLGLSSGLFFERAFRQGSRRDWALGGLFLALATATQYLAALLVVPLGLFALFAAWRDGHVSTLLRRGVVVLLAGIAGLALIWTLPGPRASLLLLWNEAAFRSWHPQRLVGLLATWALGRIVGQERLSPYALWLGASPFWLVFALGWAVKRSTAHSQNRQWLLGLAVVVPLLMGTLVFSAPTGRHYTASLGFFLVMLAVGVEAIWRQRAAAGALMLLLLVAGQSALTVDDLRYTSRAHGLRDAIAFVTAAAQPDELLVYTHPFTIYQNTYYNVRGLSAAYIPPEERPLSPEEAEQAVRDLLPQASSFWLVLQPSVLNPTAVEHAFNRLAFPASKQWFSNSIGLVHYFGPEELNVAPADLIWDDRIALVEWAASSPEVAAGDAIRFTFTWQRRAPVETPWRFYLALYGPDGQVWAQRTAQPCNEWCPTNTWEADQITDRLAFEVPADVPPGDYTLKVGWLDAGGRFLQAHRADGSTVGALAELMRVKVGAPRTGALFALPLPAPAGVTVGNGLRVRTFTPVESSVQPGADLPLTLQVEVNEPQPPLGVWLLLRGRGGTVRTVEAPFSPAWYSPERWQVPRVLRLQPRFLLPADLPAGTYALSLVLVPQGVSPLDGVQVPVGRLEVRDRPRTFTVPPIGEPVNTTWQQGVRLVRAEWPQEVEAGQTVPVILVWQAGGPTDRRYKVFVHLRDETNRILAQHDTEPAGGAAPTSGWQAGEVVVDEHPLTFPADMPPGTYDLFVGLYEEATGMRLPLASGGNEVKLGTVSVTAPLAPRPTE